MQILEHDHQRLLGGAALEQRADTARHPVALVLLDRRTVLRRPAQLRQQAKQPRLDARHQRTSVGCVAPAQQIAQQLCDRRVRLRRERLKASPAGHDDTFALGQLAHRAHQPRLTDTRLPRHHHHTPGAARRRAQHQSRALQLPLPPDQHGTDDVHRTTLHPGCPRHDTTRRAPPLARKRAPRRAVATARAAGVGGRAQSPQIVEAAPASQGDRARCRFCLEGAAQARCRDCSVSTEATVTVARPGAWFDRASKSAQFHNCTNFDRRRCKPSYWGASRVPSAAVTTFPAWPPTTISGRGRTARRLRRRRRQLTRSANQIAASAGGSRRSRGLVCRR